MAANKTLQYFLAPLLKKFFQDMGRDPNNLEMLLIKQQAGKLLKDSNKIINFPQKRSFAEEIKAMKKSGDIVDTDNMVISDKITEREMFKNSNLNKPRPVKTEEELKIKFDKENQESIQRFKDKMKKEDDPKFYTGGIVDVEPSLDDIGHGSDALMARTRLVSPGNQATTSTGLNYLLAEDNDNMRVPFAGGKSFSESELLEFNKAIKEKIKKGGRSNMPVIDPEEYKKYLESFKTTKAAEGGRIGFSDGGIGRREFLKLLAALTGATAAAKSGILSLGGKEAGKKAVTETVKKAAGSGNPPPYFFKLVDKIRTLGDDTLASKDKAIAKKYKDYYMEEDFAGNIEIVKKGEDFAGNKIEDVYMSYKVDDVALKNKKGFAKAEEYEEFTARPDMEGKMKDVEPGVPDEVVNEGSVFEDNMTEFGMTKKADGGRIGFNLGSLAKLGITSSSRRFLEKVFGKENLEIMLKRDPEMHRGLLEVVEMFRNRDKEGLKMYMQKFLPHMDDETVEAFIKGDAADAAGQAKYGLDNIQGQLIRLGSGRDYQGKIEAMKKLENAQKLDALDVTEEMIRKPNASGGIQTMLGE